MRVMIVLVPKQINNDRTAPGITTSAVCGVEVNLSCDYKTHFPGAGVTLTPWRSCMSECRCKLNMHTHTKWSTQSHKENEKRKNCFPNHTLFPGMPVRLVWKREWAACKSIGTRDLVSSKSSADWHVLHVISCIVLRGERLSFSDWLVKGCFAVVHVCLRGGSICLSVNDAGSPSSSDRGWIMSNITHPPSHTHDSPIKGFFSLPFSFQKSSDLWQWILEKFCASFDAC